MINVLQRLVGYKEVENMHHVSMINVFQRSVGYNEVENMHHVAAGNALLTQWPPSRPSPTHWKKANDTLGIAPNSREENHIPLSPLQKDNLEGGWSADL